MKKDNVFPLVLLLIRKPVSLPICNLLCFFCFVIKLYLLQFHPAQPQCISTTHSSTGTPQTKLWHRKLDLPYLLNFFIFSLKIKFVVIAYRVADQYIWTHFCMFVWSEYRNITTKITYSIESLVGTNTRILSVTVKSWCQESFGCYTVCSTGK